MERFDCEKHNFHGVSVNGNCPQCDQENKTGIYGSCPDCGQDGCVCGEIQD